VEINPADELPMYKIALLFSPIVISSANEVTSGSANLAVTHPKSVTSDALSNLFFN